MFAYHHCTRIWPYLLTLRNIESNSCLLLPLGLDSLYDVVFFFYANAYGGKLLWPRSVLFRWMSPVEMWWHTVTHGRGSEGENGRIEWVASTLHTTSEHGVSNITTADAHTSAASSRPNWCPRPFKWIRPFRRKTKSGFYACAITFQTQSTKGLLRYGTRDLKLNARNHICSIPTLLLSAQLRTESIPSKEQSLDCKHRVVWIIGCTVCSRTLFI